MLTATERKMVLEAADMVDRGVEDYSCLALTSVCGSYLAMQYALFYGKNWTSQWFPMETRNDLEQARAQRVLMLLTFAEVG